MKEQDLIDLGFSKKICPYKAVPVFFLGERVVVLFGKRTISTMFQYDLSSQKLNYCASEFCVIERICIEKNDIKKFIEAINFLYNKDISLLS